MFWRKKPRKNPLRFPVQASHREYSMILSAHDDVPASKDLLEIGLKASEMALHMDMKAISERLKSPPDYPSIWPGEHYKLLAALTALLQPSYLIEIGTATGLSALCMKAFLPSQGTLITYDLIPWHQIPNTVLQESDFSDGRLIQFTEDLSHPTFFEKHLPYLEKASLFFIDATHDGALERALLKQLNQIAFATPPLIVLDDIRVWTMLKLWRDIQKPKLDLTSFGHWSGTGLVHWTKGAVFTNPQKAGETTP